MAKAKKTNKLQNKAKKQQLLKKVTQGLETKGNVKNTAIETGRDVLVGVLGGGLLGAAIGKPSLYLGAGVTGAGHYMGNRTVSLLGIGMMAANGFQSSKSVEGLNGMDMQSVKERINTYKDNLMEKTYMDKVLHKGNGKSGKTKQAKEETSGFGALQFFTYPNDRNNQQFPALDRVHSDVHRSGMAHMERHGMDVEDHEDSGYNEHSYQEEDADNDGDISESIQNYNF